MYSCWQCSVISYLNSCYPAAGAHELTERRWVSSYFLDVKILEHLKRKHSPSRTPFQYDRTMDTHGLFLCNIRLGQFEGMAGRLLAYRWPRKRENVKTVPKRSLWVWVIETNWSPSPEPSCSSFSHFTVGFYSVTMPTIHTCHRFDFLSLYQTHLSHSSTWRNICS